MTLCVTFHLLRLGAAKALTRAGGSYTYPELVNPIERYDF